MKINTKFKKQDSTLENNGKLNNDKENQCFLQNIEFSYKTQITFQDFFNVFKENNTKFSSFDLKEIFRFIDVKNTGSFSIDRWADFSSLFLSSFNQCDTDKNCILDKNELTACLSKNETSVVNDYPDTYQEGNNHP